MSNPTLKFKIRGVVPLVQHNGQLADPLNSWTKEVKKISGKRDKTDADYEEMARLEWYGGLYLDNKKPCIPAEVMEACLVTAAKKNKNGKKALAGLFCPNNFLLEYSGPQELKERWEDETCRYATLVRVGMARIMRMRPIFQEWGAEIAIEYDPHQLNENVVTELVATAGDVGLMERRPRFGRFVVEE